VSKATHPHTFIDPVCGLPAFHIVRVPRSGDSRCAADHEHIDGRPVQSGDEFACDSCHRRFNYDDLGTMMDGKNYVARVA
jgi:hypothetical protein